ncbi:MAG: AAA family ATPase [Candidatus Brocadiia bacterium]
MSDTLILSHRGAPRDATELQKVIRSLTENVEQVIVGKKDVIELLAIGFLTGGHVLIEDVPGVGKTMIARSLARSVAGEYKRIQFTPDLLPSDVTGANLFNMKEQEFEFRQGPIFTNILLADEINRGTPRTQSSLLECMEEGVATADGVTYELPQPFYVMATQNPVEQYGTYPLPEAQLDRFCMRLRLGYPTAEEESEIVRSRIGGEPIEELDAVMEPEDVLKIRDRITQIHVADNVREYSVQICAGTREHENARLGASPRGSIWLVRIAQGLAALEGRNFVIPHDVKRAAVPVLSHRVIADPYAGSDEISTDAVVRNVLNEIAVPVVGQKQE